MTSTLFSPITLAGVTFPNRIVISPMCQYSAVDGSANDWHLIHLGHLSLSGAALLVLEATGVTAQGRITPGCLGLYSDDNERALASVLDACRRRGNTALGIQLGHAGRKASAEPPWIGGKALKPEDGAWPTVAPSALPFAEGWHVPRAFTSEEMNQLRRDFVAAARRAARLGFDLLELHGAHGYLLHQFLSPLSNQRTDAYGGSLENRMRLPLEIFEEVREVWPTDRPLGVRVSATDWVDGGWTLDDTVAFGNALKERGCDFLDVSSGGSSPAARVPVGPGYQVPLAARLKQDTGLHCWAVGMITEAGQAERIIAEGDADMVALGRVILDDPRWPWHAALELGAEAAYPNQYARARPAVWPGHRRIQA
jgi:2,4-dienoyl-CoA reductase-like NADH-dependent reductase (Old Yellow Enzyme family)